MDSVNPLVATACDSNEISVGEATGDRSSLNTGSADVLASDAPFDSKNRRVRGCVRLERIAARARYSTSPSTSPGGRKPFKIASDCPPCTCKLSQVWPEPASLLH